MTATPEKELKDLSAKELKAIAKKENLTFDPMADKPTMLKVLADAKITTIPDGGSDNDDDGDDGAADVDDTDEQKPVKLPKKGKPGTFTVQSNIIRNGKSYSKGDKISFEEVDDEVHNLIKDKVIR